MINTDSIHKIDNHGIYTFVFIVICRHNTMHSGGVIKAESKTLNFSGLGNIDNEYCKVV